MKRIKGYAAVDKDLWGDKTPYTIEHPIGNLYAGAWVLSMYLKERQGDYYEAITCYKGYSKLGKRQAKHVLRIANEH